MYLRLARERCGYFKDCHLEAFKDDETYELLIQWLWNKFKIEATKLKII
jgi:hypothetical protein